MTGQTKRFNFVANNLIVYLSKFKIMNTTNNTLQNEIDNIVNNRYLSNRQKHEALIKCGLRPADIRMLSFSRRMSRLHPVYRIGDLTFGVEIECINAPRYDLCREVQSRGINIAYEGYNHNDYHDRFKLVTDASLHGSNPIECVSPILKGVKGESDLRLVCEALNAIGASVNRSCGLHVHFDASKMSDEHYIRIFKNYQKLEALIDKFMPVSRRGSNAPYCDTIVRFNYGGCNRKSDVCSVMGGRYYKVNPRAYSSHKTIEFRHHSGTVNYTKIIMWVNFLRDLIKFSHESEITTTPTSLDELTWVSPAVKEYYKARIESLA